MTNILPLSISTGIWTAVAVLVLFFWGWLIGGAIRKRYGKKVYEPPALTEWRTTGVIDFIARDDIMLSDQDGDPAQFTLRVQEQRQVANIAGSPTTEHRWRLATKAEAKDVVSIVSIYRHTEKAQ